MLPGDLSEIMKIENEAFPNPWAKTTFTDHLRHPEFANYIVAVSDGHIAGYAGLFFGDGQGQITNLAVHRDWRRQGVASRLLLELFNFCSRESVMGLSLEVRVSNDDAQTLYEKFGFTKVGVRKDYYQEIGEDAYMMCIFNIDEPAVVRDLWKIKKWLSLDG